PEPVRGTLHGPGVRARDPRPAGPAHGRTGPDRLTGRAAPRLCGFPGRWVQTRPDLYRKRPVSFPQTLLYAVTVQFWGACRFRWARAAGRRGVLSERSGTRGRGR